MPLTPSYTATVLGGFFPVNSVNSLTGIGKQGDMRVAAQVFQASPALRAIGKALNGVAPGAVANAVNFAIESNQEMGGKRTIVQEVVINRATNAQDVIDFSLFYAYGDLDPLVNVPNLDQNPLGTR